MTAVRMMTAAVRSCAPLLLLVVLAGPASGQQLTVTAELPLGSPTGAGVRNLSFGSITPQATPVTVDVPAAVAPLGGGAASAEYRFNVGATRGMTFSITPPTQLTAAGVVTPLSVNYNDTRFGAWCVVQGGSACTLTNFNPTAASIQVCRQVGNGNCHPNQAFAAGSVMSIYVGGVLTVPAAQRAATYTGVLTLTVIQVH